MTLIDTAEMYADGAAETLVGEAIAGRRDSVFLVTKVLPHHATRAGTVRACHDSLRRLGTDRIDLYLLHWRGNAPLAQTVDCLRHRPSRDRAATDEKAAVKLPGGIPHRTGHGPAADHRHHPLSRALAAASPRDTVTMDFTSDGQKKTVQVTLAELPGG